MVLIKGLEIDPKRSVFAFGQVDAKMLTKVGEKIFQLYLEDPCSPILMLISSPGGETLPTRALWEGIKVFKVPLVTLGLGACYSVGLDLLQLGQTRLVTAGTFLLFHEPRTRGEKIPQMRFSDFDCLIREWQWDSDYWFAVFEEKTGKSKEALEVMAKQEYLMDAKFAKEQGFVDEIVTPEDVIF